MAKATNLTDCWQGRVDREDADQSRRLHQHVQLNHQPDDYQQAPVLLGFASDEGVRRNLGQPGAAQGPEAARKALANLCCSAGFEFYDNGDVVCDGDQLEQAQQQLADQIQDTLLKNGRPFVLGGGHEIGWASFLGAQQYLQQLNIADGNERRLGILNFDAHFDLRNPQPVTSSGTPFRQAQQWSEQHEVDFNYFVFGLNPSANNDALFEFAYDHSVQWVEDLDCNWSNYAVLKQQLRDWLVQIDALYLTVCLDVFPAAFAPGVSAPAAVGVEPALVLKMLQFIAEEMESTGKEIILVDVAELNPGKDIDGRTAKLAARYIYQMML